MYREQQISRNLPLVFRIEIRFLGAPLVPIINNEVMNGQPWPGIIVSTSLLDCLCTCVHGIYRSLPIVNQGRHKLVA